MPASCANHIDLWQEYGSEARFEEMEREMALMEKDGFNAVRLLLGDYGFAVWRAEHDGMMKRFERMLEIFDRHGVRVILIFGNDCSRRKRASSIVACRGRRRIGKSTLFREFARRSADVYMEFEGLAPNPEKPVTNADQLNEFATRLAKLTNSPILHLQNWQDAFFWLDRAIDDDKKTVILLDEISWMAADDPQFPAVLRNAWESFFHCHEKLILVVCASVSAWIKKNILGNMGFTGRFSRDYVLTELSLRECAEFWRPAGEHLNAREIIDVLSVTGGVPPLSGRSRSRAFAGREHQAHVLPQGRGALQGL